MASGRDLIAALAGLFWFVLCALLVIVIIGSDAPAAKQKASCVAAGGHYVTKFLDPDECWSNDGTRRLWPDGF